MQIESPFEALHNAMSHAVMVDLPDIRYWQRDWVAYRALPKKEADVIRGDGEGPGEWKTRRPLPSEVRVTMFDDIWPSTALGYGGIGGAAMTPAYTVIVSCDDVHCVYFGGGPLAYTVDRAKQSIIGAVHFDADLSKRHMVSKSEAHRYK